MMMTRLVRLFGSFVVIAVFLPLLVLGGLVVMGCEGINRMCCGRESTK